VTRMPKSAADETASLLEAGMQHHGAGRLREAERAYRQALRRDDSHPQALHLLGIIAGQSGQYAAAVELFRRALARDQENADLHQNLGEAYRHQGDAAHALSCFRQAIKLRPELFQAYRNAADAAQAEAARMEKASHAEAAREMRRIAAIYLEELGRLYARRNWMQRAEPIFREAAALAPGEVSILNWLGTTQIQLGRPSEAEATLRRAIALDHRHAYARSDLAHSLFALGRIAEANAAVEEALRIDPGLAEAKATRLAYMQYRGEVTAEEIFVSHRDWGAEAAAQTAATPFANAKEPDRRLKIGFVSGDFREHSVRYFFEPLLRMLDRARFETFCYSAVLAPDAVTARLQRMAQHWRSTNAMSDEQLRLAVRQDAIDILIDLAGHTDHGRVLAFAEKPAPVTATWLGYPGTTGLPTMDYRITDALADPPGAADRLHTERLVRLPRGFLCYEPPAEAPPVASLPALTSGRVTFGSFNNLLKVTPEVVALWGQVLRALPQARLVLKATLLSDNGVRRRYLDLFAAGGVGPDRIELREPVAGIAGHLAVYGEIDIALDPFPYNGTATTCEALWMGVPVVTLVGDRHASRVGSSLLHRLSLQHLAAATPEAYLEAAAALARDLAGLACLRAGLRERMLASSLCDEAGFAGDFGAALRQMWREWCGATVDPRPALGAGN
jgi:protein O-GlcNAc transferase